MKRLKLKTSTGETGIFIAAGLLAGLPESLSRKHKGGAAVVVTDTYLAPGRAGKFAEALGKHRDTILLRVPRGEKAKTMAVAERLCARMLRRGVGRDALLVAFGGGCVGDVAGFVAATYMRGIAFAQIPTTLNAQADSCIGGKTGVNLPDGKNIIGAFYQPSLVFIDPTFLRSLPEREFAAGMAEVIKTAFIGDPRLFAFIERNHTRILKRDTKTLEKIVGDCIRVKAGVVERDEKEGGPRMILNFGHTFGHAIETASRHRKFRHGEAVAMGMSAAAAIARGRGLCEDNAARRLVGLLEKFGLPTQIPPSIVTRIPRIMARDKKARADGIVLVLPRSVGRAEVIGGFAASGIAKMMKES